MSTIVRIQKCDLYCQPQPLQTPKSQQVQASRPRRSLAGLNNHSLLSLFSALHFGGEKTRAEQLYLQHDTMSQIRGTAGYNLGLQNQFGGPSRNDATSDPSPLDAIREQTGKVEDWLNSVGEPLRP